MNYERSEDWLKRKDQPRNTKSQFTSPSKNTGNGLNLSIISDDDFECYNKSEGKPVQTNIEDELQLLPKNNSLTPEQGRYKKNNPKKPTESARRSNTLGHQNRKTLNFAYEQPFIAIPSYIIY